MKKALIGLLGLLVVLIAALLAIPETRQALHWQWAMLRNSTSSYESYVRVWPQGSHLVDARMRYDESHWRDALRIDTPHVYELYLERHQEPEHAAEAVSRIDSLRWLDAVSTNTASAYQRYVDLQSDGVHIAEALQIVDTLSWDDAVAADTIAGYGSYLTAQPTGARRGEAEERIDALRWQEASSVHTIRSYQQYLRRSPAGRHLADAEERIAALRVDPAPFELANQGGTEAALNLFVTEYPGHASETEARQVLADITEGRDIVALLSDSRIELQAQGSGLETVTVRIRRRIPFPLTVSIPVGTFFVAHDKSSQNMVSTEGRRITLDSDDWQSVTLSAACANIWRDTPGSDDTFAVTRSPHQHALALLMPTLASSGVGDDVRQAAVWIVTDNADYSDLGVLVYGFGGFGPRAISEPEAARAMEICDDAGIDITSLDIWHDHESIYWGLDPDSTSRQWLEARSPSIARQARDAMIDIEQKLALTDQDLQASLRARPLSIYLAGSGGSNDACGTWLCRYLEERGHEVVSGDLISIPARVDVYYQDDAELEARAASQLLEIVCNAAVHLHGIDELSYESESDLVIQPRR